MANTYTIPTEGIKMYLPSCTTFNIPNFLSESKSVTYVCFMVFSFMNIVIYLFILNVTVERVASLLHIREVTGSTLAPETDYPEVFMAFLSPSRKMPG
jgi:hypothetical protein